MAVEAYDDQMLMDDDELPLVFKRSISSGKQNQSTSEDKKWLSQKPDRAATQDVRFQNGQGATAQTSKMIPFSKSPSVKSPLSNLKSTNSSTKGLAAKSFEANSKLSTSAIDKPNSIPCKIKDVKPSTETNEESDDSDDDKPISTKLPTSLLKPNSNHAKNDSLVSTSSQQLKIPKPENSDDEMPLSSRFHQVKPNVGTCIRVSPNSCERKPTLSKFEQNGSASTERKPSANLKKRPGDEGKVASASHFKKPKLSVTPTYKSKETSVKAEMREDDDDDDDDNVPISQRMKKDTSAEKKASSLKNTSKPIPTISKTNKKPKSINNSKFSKSFSVPPGTGGGKKWTTLIHNGLIFPPPYKPHGVKILYKGKPVELTPEQEEVATMYAVMLDTEYMNKPRFKENFMTDWRTILGKNHVIQSLEHCDFSPIYEWHLKEKEKKKQMTSEEKKVLKEEKQKKEEKYMWAIVDGVQEKVGNFRVEGPGLFRGRGEHPKMGKLKKRIYPSDITINIGKDAPIPECPMPGESWKEIRHDNTVTWLAYWNDPINQKEFKYVFLAASSNLKGQSDREKYEKARRLKDYIDDIRATYTKNFTSGDLSKRQIAVATYLIDKLALRAGNEKDDEAADTVGCCTLKVENVEPVPPNILKFDFLGKDSIRYLREVEVVTPVFQAIQHFRYGKKDSDDLFDKLDTSKLNAHLKELMPGLTAKVFRTYNASITLDDMLSRQTRGGDVAQKAAVYQNANKEVAIICNHQRADPKSHGAQMLKLNEKIDEAKVLLEELQKDLARARKGKPPTKSADGKTKRNLTDDALERKIAQCKEKIEKMERAKDEKEDMKNVALGTSKINYNDPRITVAWCKRHEVPIEKFFTKTLLAKFVWAMDVGPDFRF